MRNSTPDGVAPSSRMKYPINMEFLWNYYYFKKDYKKFLIKNYRVSQCGKQVIVAPRERSCDMQIGIKV